VAPGRDATIVGPIGKDQDAVHEIPEYVGKVLIAVGNEAIDREISVGTFRSVGDQPPPPEVGR
jgi:hypothetical protein